MKKTIATAAVLIAATLAPAANASSDWQWRYRVWMPAVWQRLAQCESGSNPPNWRHDGPR